MALALLGCASPAQPVAMVPGGTGAAPFELKPGATVVRTVTIRTYGGKSTFPLGTSQISNGAFTEALARAVVQAGLLYPVFDRSSDYRLDVTFAVDQPFWGFNMSVTIVAKWRVSRADRGDVVWDDIVSTTYTADYPKATFGIKRLRLANEGAARLNIEEGIRRLSAVDLQKRP